MAAESAPEQQSPTGSPEDWVDWFLSRLHQDPWTLGGGVVIGMFMLAFLCLVVFALLYGCCCGQEKEKKKKMKRSEDGVI